MKNKVLMFAGFLTLAISLSSFDLVTSDELESHEIYIELDAVYNEYQPLNAYNSVGSRWGGGGTIVYICPGNEEVCKWTPTHPSGPVVFDDVLYKDHGRGSIEIVLFP